MEKFFKLKERNTNVKTEILAGITTFMAMAYILAVNPNILSAALPKGTSLETIKAFSLSIFTATALSSAVATILMGVIGNFPFALSAGMGLNAYFAYTVCGNMGASWEFALAAVFVEGVIFILLSAINVREAMFNAIPLSLKTGVSAGIGLFIAIIALINANVLQSSPSTIVQLIPFHQGISGADPLLKMQVVCASLCLIGIIITALLINKNVKGSILLGILITWGIGIIFELTGIYQPGVYAKNMYLSDSNVVNAAKEAFTKIGLDPTKLTFADLDKIKINELENSVVSFFSVIPHGIVDMPASMAPTFGKFVDGFKMIGVGGEGIMNFIIVVISFLFVDIFDTLGTLIGCAKAGNMLNERGRLHNVKYALFADAVGTTFGAVAGTSTVTTFVESASGVQAGGRTGLTAITTAILFLLAMFFWPIFSVIPSFATSPALIIVGFLMMKNVKDIPWDDATESIPAFLAIIAMPFFYSISEGIAFGIISYCAINLLSGNGKKVTPTMFIIAVLFILKYIFV